MARPERRGWYTAPLSHGQVMTADRSSVSWELAISLTSPCNERLISLHDASLVVSGRGLSPMRLAPRAAIEPGPASLVEHVIADVSAASGEIEHVAVSMPRQSTRPHFVMLTSGPRGRLFIKAGPNGAVALLEREALRRLDGGTDRVGVPALVASGEGHGYHWSVTEALPPGRHRPVWTWPGDEIGVLTSRLEGVLPVGPDDDDPAPTVCHGDLAPWNLRLAQGRTWLIDWSDVRAGPSGFDRLYFEVAATALSGEPGVGRYDDASFHAVRRIIDERVDSGAESLDLAMRALL